MKHGNGLMKIPLDGAVLIGPFQSKTIILSDQVKVGELKGSVAIGVSVEWGLAFS